MRLGGLCWRRKESTADLVLDTILSEAFGNATSQIHASMRFQSSDSIILVKLCKAEAWNLLDKVENKCHNLPFHDQCNTGPNERNDLWQGPPIHNEVEHAWIWLEDLRNSDAAHAKYLLHITRDSWGGRSNDFVVQVVEDVEEFGIFYNTERLVLASHPKGSFHAMSGRVVSQALSKHRNGTRLGRVCRFAAINMSNQVAGTLVMADSRDGQGRVPMWMWVSSSHGKEIGQLTVCNERRSILCRHHAQSWVSRNACRQLRTRFSVVRLIRYNQWMNNVEEVPPT